MHKTIISLICVMVLIWLLLPSCIITRSYTVVMQGDHNSITVTASVPTTVTTDAQVPIDVGVIP